MPSYEDYLRRGYGLAVSELYAREDEEQEEREALAEQWRASLPPLTPDRVFEVGDSRISAYLDGKAGEMLRREGEAGRIRGGGRR